MVSCVPRFGPLMRRARENGKKGLKKSKKREIEKRDMRNEVKVKWKREGASSDGEKGGKGGRAEGQRERG